jgi:hypothetical protein
MTIKFLFMSRFISSYFTPFRFFFDIPELINVYLKEIGWKVDVYVGFWFIISLAFKNQFLF